MLNDHSSSYPQVYYPKNIQIISNTEIKYTDIYPNSVPKDNNYITTKSKNDEGYDDLLGSGCLLLILLFFFFIITRLIIHLFSFDVENEFINITVIIFTILTFIYIYVTNENDVEKNKEEEKLRRNLANEKFKESKIKYEETVKNWKESKLDEKIKINRIKNLLLNERPLIFSNLKINLDKSLKKGASENFFYLVLNNFFSGKVYVNTIFKFYFPDFILVKDNLIINVEIDEPYSFEKKEPIHFNDVDLNRNLFFKENGICTIRFSELQILDEPLLCIDFINSVIKSCTELIKIDNFYYRELYKDKWTYEEAFHYAYNQSREEINKKIQYQLEILEIT